MPSYGAVICARNDNYGYFLTERAVYCLGSMLAYLDEVIYIDWNTKNNKPTLIEEIVDYLPADSDKSKLKWIKITPEQVSKWTNNDPDVPAVCDVLARNIGLRRLKSDFLISTNIDIVCPQRFHIEKFTDPNTFYTAGKRSISMFDLFTIGQPHQRFEYITGLERVENNYGQQPVVQVCPEDNCSLVSGCGDWQVAHRDVWNTIRGFEERLNKRGYADSNVQRKAQIYGYKAIVEWSVPVWHIGHTGGMSGGGAMNDMNLAIFMNETTNPDTWGFSDVDLKIHSL
jgi:hypothetical protein